MLAIRIAACLLIAALLAGCGDMAGPHQIESKDGRWTFALAEKWFWTTGASEDREMFFKTGGLAYVCKPEDCGIEAKLTVIKLNGADEFAEGGEIDIRTIADLQQVFPPEVADVFAEAARADGNDVTATYDDATFGNAPAVDLDMIKHRTEGPSHLKFRLTCYSDLCFALMLRAKGDSTAKIGELMREIEATATFAEEAS